MADDRVRKLAEDALNHLTAELEAGKSQAPRGNEGFPRPAKSSGIFADTLDAIGSS